MSINIENIWNFDLKKGNGHDPKDGACLMDAISWFEYGTLGDHPECSCPVIAAYCRNMNDAMTDAGRQKLKVFIPRLIGNRDPSAEKARAEYLVWQTIRVFTPFWLDKAEMHDKATELRKFVGSFYKAKVLLQAATSASAAYAASYAAAYASAYAAAAASAAAYAASAAAASSASEWEPLMLAAFDGVLHIGKQAEPIEPARIMAANEAFQRAREKT